MRKFTRTPYYQGPDDPEIGEVRGPLQLGETVVIETVGGHDQDYEKDHPLRAGAVMEVFEKRFSRPGGRFHIEGIGPGDWVAIEIIDIEVGPYGFYRNGGPHWGSIRLVAPEEEWLTSGRGSNWEEAVNSAWSEMVALIADEYDTTVEYANLLVGTLADARPGYAAGGLNSRGRPSDGAYVTCQLAMTKEIRRTGQPFEA